MANVKVIPATKLRHSGAPIESKTTRRVAGYARVSTDSSLPTKRRSIIILSSSARIPTGNSSASIRTKAFLL